MKPSVFVFGVSGRMGKELKKIIEVHPNLSWAGGYSNSQPNLEVSQSPDLVIDFSLPETLPVLTDFVKKHQSALVSGTTGYSRDDLEKLKTLGLSCPVFWAANMSFGVYLMCRLTETLAKYDQFYQMQVEETHHVHKKDKPSGTAIIIEEAAKKSTKQLLETISHREGEVFGLHKFRATSNNETLEIIHEAHNRALFAQGAVDIARWLKGKEPGFYGMDDFFQAFQR